MHSVWKTSILFTLVTAVVFGLGYPLLVTGIARVIFPRQAAGSLILKDGQVIGSELLAQSFTSDKTLVTRIQGDIDKLAAANPGRPVPIDMVTTSGSGLDPDITPDNAYFQAPRVAKARGLTEDQIRQLIQQHIAARQLGLLGEPRVNVLDLNLALDNLAK